MTDVTHTSHAERARALDDLTRSCLDELSALDHVHRAARLAMTSEHSARIKDAEAAAAAARARQEAEILSLVSDWRDAIAACDGKRASWAEVIRNAGEIIRRAREELGGELSAWHLIAAAAHGDERVAMHGSPAFTQYETDHAGPLADSLIARVGRSTCGPLEFGDSVAELERAVERAVVRLHASIDPEIVRARGESLRSRVCRVDGYAAARDAEAALIAKKAEAKKAARAPKAPAPPRGRRQAPADDSEVAALDLKRTSAERELLR